ncbi:MAG: ribosome small subunit-dependent GTPase A [Coriobacteriia bacterium]|nr:ribosome small subunit-dependent GTPase A [Coriobacteriia bacterium]
MTDAYLYNFNKLGFTAQLQAQYEQTLMEAALPDADAAHCEPARVVKVDRGFPLVVAASGSYRTELSSQLAQRARKDALARPAVGDWVVLARPAGHDFGIVEAFLPRNSSLKRRDPIERKSAGFAPAQQAIGQVVVANIDLIFVVQALRSESCSVNLARLERELVLAFESGAQPLIVLTKADLCPDLAASERFIQMSAADVPIITCSALTGRGITEIRRLISPGVTAALIGASGVGKSTLINQLIGTDRQLTKEVRETDDRGRHATVARELIELPLIQTCEGPSGGGVIIDTPGMRSLALWQADQGITLAFPEITAAAHNCRFADCAHKNEPHCGVKAAVAAGDIDAERYKRYLRLVRELADA